MFERFTDRARQVVVLAQDESRTLGHDSVDTEHLLLGILREEEGIGARALESLHVNLDEARTEVERLVGQGERQTIGQIPFTAEAKRALEEAGRAAAAFGHARVGTEHLLLGVLEYPGTIAARVLAGLGVEPAAVRTRTIELLRKEDVPTPRELRCSFCGKRKSEVRGLVAGPTPDVAICNECVDLCREILEESGSA